MGETTAFSMLAHACSFPPGLRVYLELNIVPSVAVFCVRTVTLHSSFLPSFRPGHKRMLCICTTKKFSEGPHCRIVGPGSLKESSFTNVFLYPKKYYKTKPFSHPRDRQCEGARMGSQVTCLDGLVEKRVSESSAFLSACGRTNRSYP